MTTLERTTVDELLDRVERIRPIIEEHAAWGEANRRIAPEVFQAVRDAGLLRIWLPAAFGGHELHPAGAYRLLERISEIDGAVGWNLNQHAAVTVLATWLQQQGLEEVFSNPDSGFAGVFWPAGAAIEVPGGFRVTANVRFASNSQFAEWFLVPAIVHENGAPRIDPQTGGPDFLATIIHMSEGAIQDSWHTMGMRATASNDVLVDDVFVPAQRAVRVFAPRETPAAVSGPLYRLAPWPGVQAHATVPLGIARAMVNRLVNLAATKVPNFYETTLRDRPVAQFQAAEARAAVDAASAYLASTASNAFNALASGRALTMDEKCAMQLAAANAAEATIRATSLVHQAAGTSGMREGAGFEKLYRDASSIVQHAAVQTNRFESAGRVMFGLEPDWFAFQL
ncbi:MAG: acyl-CoA dehydrogenase family protein [Dehalococcoidia bacterium]